MSEDGSLGALTVAAAIDAVGAKTPTPGGGAVASVTGALSAALARMVVAYSVGKKKLAEHADLHGEALEQLGALARRALELADEDAAAYGRLNALWKLDEDDPARRAEWDDAVAGAIAAPEAILTACVEVLELVSHLLDKTSRMLRSDLAIAGILAEAGARSAAWNVRINLPQLTDEDEAERLELIVRGRLDHAAALAAQIERECRA